MFFLTQKAYDDLKAIALYTQETWGKSQRTIYLQMMDAVFHYNKKVIIIPPPSPLVIPAKNPVRDYRSVEKENTPMPCIPSGMQPVFCDTVAFLRNAGVT